jgi:hypothetical protein|tara:strand:- start:93 stop:665 length:573 start_codon:yes stop_codon:yes gene_type:complete
MEIILQFWQFSIVIALVWIGFIWKILDKDVKPNMEFKAISMPHMKPIPIPTKGKGFWGGIKVWLFVSRKWEISEDYHYEIDGEKLVIPKGFVFDGASVPKFLHTWLSPMGVLLVGGLVHDYGYKHATLLKLSKQDSIGIKTQKELDIIFRDINIIQNGFRLINYLAYYGLRLGGFAAWNKHRKANIHWSD